MPYIWGCGFESDLHAPAELEIRVKMLLSLMVITGAIYSYSVFSELIHCMRSLLIFIVLTRYPQNYLMRLSQRSVERFTHPMNARTAVLTASCAQ